MHHFLEIVPENRVEHGDLHRVTLAPGRMYLRTGEKVTNDQSFPARIDTMFVLNNRTPSHSR